MKRFTHFKSVVFELNQQIVEAGNKQKAIQVYLNQLSNSLRQDEREKLRIADISYKPTSIKSVTPKSIKTVTTSKKIDKVELRKYAAELGVSEFTLQMIVVQKGISVATAANLIRNSIKECEG
jgi:DNA integrity scanning protein DisA with diadenylate cyclase activity